MSIYGLKVLTHLKLSTVYPANKQFIGDHIPKELLDELGNGSRHVVELPQPVRVVEAARVVEANASTSKKPVAKKSTRKKSTK